MKTYISIIILFIALTIPKINNAQRNFSNSNNSKFNTIKVYPNPLINKGFLQVNLEYATDLNVEIIDISGKVVKNVTNDFYYDGINKIALNIDNLKEGIYFLKVSTEQWIKTKRILIQK